MPGGTATSTSGARTRQYTRREHPTHPHGRFLLNDETDTPTAGGNDTNSISAGVHQHDGGVDCGLFTAFMRYIATGATPTSSITSNTLLHWQSRRRGAGASASTNSCRTGSTLNSSCYRVNEVSDLPPPIFGTLNCNTKAPLSQDPAALDAALFLSTICSTYVLAPQLCDASI
jgi:hypothetical protein